MHDKKNTKEIPADQPEAEITDEERKIVSIQPKLAEEAAPSATEEELDADEREFRAMRRDVDGVKGSSGLGIVAISVGKIPEKNAFFRTNRDFTMVTSILDHQVGEQVLRCHSGHGDRAAVHRHNCRD